MEAPSLRMPDLVTDKPRRRRRWIPLSLKMFVALLALAGVDSVLRVGVPMYRKQMAIRMIDRLGGKVEMKPAGPQRLRAVLGDQWMSAFDEVVNIDLSNTRASDSDLANIGALRTAVSLDLSHTHITDKGLQTIIKLPDLLFHDLEAKQITDKALQDVGTLPKLFSLNLEGTHVTDSGIRQLSSLKDLRFLDTYGTRVTAPEIEDLEEHLLEIYVV